ncbi:hypothetical protein JD276_09230 [Leucobacter sp. CSA1]|uniref:Cell division protein FtsL n=1 Tax=Leucobacter chromiisoli TaxID=2796471 RepID=A0A934Q8F9_9MICO|nr:hypothetical protein [Leucobacter chromiisoli]MBK0419215.1 hypothetical protein [Leucobacter chromiisoli]
MSNTVPIARDLLSARRDGRQATGLPESHPDAQERHLRLARPSVRQARKRGPLLGALVSVGLVLVILATQLGLSIAISEGAYETRALELEQRDLLRVERVLQQNVDKLASPQNLAENAAQLGMVQNSHPAALRLSDGAVLGDLTSPTEAVKGNLVPNATLESMPVVDAEGLLVTRDSARTASAETQNQPPVRWEGKLPAPKTH